MQSEINWLHLPDIIWESILSNLDAKCLLKASLTCKKFNDLLSISHSLMEELSLEIGNIFMDYRIRNKENEYKKYFCELKLIKECLQKSERKYESITIYDLDDHAAENYIIDVLIDILKLLAGSVKQITFCDTSLKADNFYKLIQIMKNLKVLKFKGSDFDRGQVKSVKYSVWPDKKVVVPSINEIYIDQVYNFSFEKLYLFDTITTLEVNESYTDYETFENFLSMQKNLKVLRLRHLRSHFLFQTDELITNIKFSLDELTLDEAYCLSNENAMNFFKKQINLKKVTLNLQNLVSIRFGEEMCCNELLIHFFGNNLQLNTVNLSTYEYRIQDFSFLKGIVNPSVENLELLLDSSRNGTKFIAAFTKLFPNVKNFAHTLENEVDHGLEQIHNWKYLESINCSVKDINQFFQIINLGEKLTTCTINCFYVDDIRKPQLIVFLNRHQNIKYLSLNPHFFDETTISVEILSLIVNKLKCLKTLMYRETICSLSNY